MSVLLSHVGLVVGALLLFVLPLLAGCGGGSSGTPAVPPAVPPVVPPTTPPVAEAPGDPLTVLQRAHRVLVFFAHPDDETLAAPVLADLCRSRQCRIVYATGGDRKAPEWADELPQSAALLRFESVLWSWTYVVDEPEEEARALWAAGADQVRGEVIAFAPDAILTFDPEHGVTQHPEHRLVGRVVLDALGAFDPARIVLLAGLLTWEGEVVGFRPASDDPAIRTYPTGPGWAYVQDVLRIYRSQFSDEWVAGAQRAPEHLRGISLRIFKPEGDAQ